MVSPDGVAPSRMVGVSASVNLPLHHKVQKFSFGTGSPGWSLKKGRKTVVCILNQTQERQISLSQTTILSLCTAQLTLSVSSSASSTLLPESFIPAESAASVGDVADVQKTCFAPIALSVGMARFRAKLIGYCIKGHNPHVMLHSLATKL